MVTVVSPTSNQIKPTFKENEKVSLLDEPVKPILTQPIEAVKLVETEKNKLKNTDGKSDILSLPSDDADELIVFSDIPINKVLIESKSEMENDGESKLGTIDQKIFKVRLSRKPMGSAYVSVQLSIGQTKQLIQTNVCIDTGADITLCDSAYLLTHFGNKALQYVVPMEKPPKLKSASGHNLKILGKVPLTLYLGQYQMTLNVVVHESESNIFLLGSDVFYDRLIYDRGKFLAFADETYPPIPIQYELSKQTVKTMTQFNVAPHSSALIQVKVTENIQFAGKDILLTPLTEEILSNESESQKEKSNVVFNNVPVQNTVSVIDSQGNAFMLIENGTDDILTILPETEIAKVELISESETDGQISYVNYGEINNTTFPEKQNEHWAYSALKGELADKLPANVIVQWDKIKTYSQGEKDCNENDVSNNVRYIHCKEERKNLLDGTGEGFPTPPSAESVHPNEKLDTDPEAWLKSIEHSHLSDLEWTKLKAILIERREAFSKSKTEIGCCNYFKVDLPLKPGTGYLYNKPRPLPYKYREIAAQTISELLAKGVIRLSKSPHATNIVCVKKKTMNGVVSYRICCDLRQVNEHSVPNRYPNYWLDDAMAKLQGAAFRTACDFRDAFHMLVLNPESIPVTAFFFNNVLYEYVRVPFGHVCAMNAFCCLMSLLCVGYESASYYADDLMITTKVDHKLSRDQLYDLHLKHIDGMLVRIIDAGLKLVAHKCQWCYDATQPMDWLGFTMVNNLLKPQETKVKAIRELPVPTCKKQAIAAIATASFQRRFIKDFAKIVQPIQEVAYNEPFHWTDKAQIAFDKIKDIMCSDLVLRLPRQGELFQIYSDASAGALGVALCQIDPIDKRPHPCAYGSRKFNECEMKLSIPCKELLAIIYGLNLWSFYICGNPIQVFSDCRAWTFLKMQSGVSGKISRLALLVSEYDISVSYIKGTKNKLADGLSRAFDDGLTKYDDQITARHPALNKLEAPEIAEGESLRLNDYLGKCDEYLSDHWPKVLKEYENQQKALGKEPDTDCLKQGMQVSTQNINNITKDAISEAEYVDQVIYEAAILHVDRSNPAQQNQRFGKENNFSTPIFDDSFSETMDSFTDDETMDSDDEDSDMSDDEINGTTDSSFRPACYNIRLIAINDSCFSASAFADMQEQDEFCAGKIELIRAKNSRVKESGYFLKRKILMRKMHTRDGQEYQVICIPKVLRKPLMESTHRSLLSGHFGSQRYFLNMSRKYYWPKMKDEIIDFHHHCLPCQYNDKFPVKYLSGHVIRPLYPMHVVHCDLVVGLPRALDGSDAILLLYDGFSRFTFGIPLTSQKADYVVKKLMSHFVAAFGLPWALHSDNGRNVDGALIRSLALLLGVLKTSTPPYTPNANPTETMCGAVGMLLRKALNESDQRYWSLCLPFVLNALNSTMHTATGYTPNSLFFGRFQERDPVPIIPFEAEAANVNEYFQKMRRFQELAFQITRSRNERKLLAKKVTWDITARTHKYKEGDFVLVKNKAPASGPGKKKLRAIYIGPFRVLKVYEASLIVVPWTENSRLEEYYRDPDAFRLVHRGNIKPFFTRQVSVKHCKPFHGKLETDPIVDPIMLTRFLDMLGVDNSDEVISEIDPETRSHTSDFTIPSLDSGVNYPDGHDNSSSDTDSADSGPDHGGAPVGQQDDDVVPQPEVPNNDQAEQEKDLPLLLDQETIPLKLTVKLKKGINQQQVKVEKNLVDKLVGNLNISETNKKLLKKYYEQQEAVTTAITTARGHRLKLDELECLVRSPDPAVRKRAEFELNQVLDQIKHDRAIIDDTNESRESQDSDVETIQEVEVENERMSTSTDTAEPAEEHLDEVVGDDDGPNLEWDYSEVGELGDIPPAQEVNIRMPNALVNIRPFMLPGSRNEPQTSTPMLHRRFGASRRRDVQDWLSNVSPLHGADDDDHLDVTTEEAGPQPAPRVTKSGRVSKPVSRFDDAQEALRQQELKLLAQALNRSKAEAKELKRSAVESNVAEREPRPSTSSRPPAPRSKTPTAPPASSTSKPPTKSDKKSVSEKSKTTKK